MSGIKNILAAILVNFPVAVVKMRYLMRFKRLPNLKKPHDLNEKILYQKLYADTTLWSRLADKVLVRDYVKECGLESILTKLYAVWDKATDICFDELPDTFMLKSNNGDGKGTNIAICDKKSLTASDFIVSFYHIICDTAWRNIDTSSLIVGIAYKISCTAESALLFCHVIDLDFQFLWNPSVVAITECDVSSLSSFDTCVSGISRSMVF